MSKEKFMLVSLKESKAKELAQVITNDSCRKILDFLAEKEDATESLVAEQLKLPISTVHYNLQMLIKSGIVVSEEYHYSSKGKEVNHYKLANQYIIIAPKSVYGIKEKLRSILPVSILALVGAGLIHYYNSAFSASAKMLRAAPLMQAAKESVSSPIATDSVVANGAPIVQGVGSKAVETSVRTAVEKTPEAIVNVTTTNANIALWFLFGSLFAIALLVVIELIRRKR